jgi:deoxyadenosine/deoxycytidine kinase
MIPVIWVEGLIASGKTTFARKMAELLGFRVLEEPVEINPYLEEFYKDPKRYAFGMQIYLLHHRFAMKQIAAFEAARGVAKGVILDRSIAGDRVFERLHWNCGNISDLDHQCYEYCYQMMARTILPPTVLIYLNCQPETAFRRMNNRKRKAEAGIPLDYLVDLKNGYDELLESIRRGLVPWSHSVHVERIIWDKDTATDEEWDSVSRTIMDLCR